jgi:hypothetical protein
MKVFIGFLILAFLAGGMARGEVIRRRPILLLAVSVVVGASFVSMRVIG